MAAMSENFTLETPAGTRLHGLIDYPQDDTAPRPPVVICHGFKGFMDWGFFPYLATLLAERGYVAVRFNFSGSGVRPGEDHVADPEAFRADTYSQEVAEVEAVLAALGDGIGGLRIAAGEIGLLGHSRGGGAALLAASRPAFRERIGALVTWASIGHADRFSDDLKAAWRRDGSLPVVNARTGQQLAMGLGMLEDLERHRDELDLAAAAARRTAPWLILHGDADESVPTAESGELLAVAAEPVERQLIAGAGHTFGAQHPFVGPTPDLIQVLNLTQRWYRRHLG
jgi:pimeloyl-ACP methyl ester carboxylesterase